MVAPNPITIRKERFYPHPPEDVWAAISDPHALAEWLEPNNHQPVVGHKFQFRCDPGICGSGITECEVARSRSTSSVGVELGSRSQQTRLSKARPHDDRLDIGSAR